MNASPMMLSETERNWEVTEIQGLYGPFTFTELLLQKIWLRGEFDGARATTTDGRTLRVLHPGRWNRLGGPDFLNARLRFDDAEIIGDVELHLHASDWAAHAHNATRTYDRVVLHAVLFPPAGNARARRADGSVIPTLVLLPLLFHGLEEYAAEDAVEALASRAEWRGVEQLMELPPARGGAILQLQAELRWNQKVRFAQLRMSRLGWAEACHHAALEIFGYRFNRTPMLKIAAQVPWRDWAKGSIDPEELFAAEAPAWNLQGVRPANHPRTRLRQYARWMQARPDWPLQLDRRGIEMPVASPEGSTRTFRKQLNLAACRARLAAEVTGGAVAGTRLDNLVCDGFLPLLAARAGRDYQTLWHHWFPGDLPPRLAAALKGLGICGPRVQPLCHGLAQGLLGWLLAREERTQVI